VGDGMEDEFATEFDCRGVGWRWKLFCEGLVMMS